MLVPSRYSPIAYLTIMMGATQFFNFPESLCLAHTPQQEVRRGLRKNPFEWIMETLTKNEPFSSVEWNLNFQKSTAFGSCPPARKPLFEIFFIFFYPIASPPQTLTFSIFHGEQRFLVKLTNYVAISCQVESAREKFKTFGSPSNHQVGSSFRLPRGHSKM